MAVTKSLRKTMSFAALTAVLATTAVGTAVPTAAGATQVREVCAKSVYVKKQPGVGLVGSVTKGQKVTVTRYSQSRTFAHIVARAPGRTVRGWMPTRYLCS